MSGFAKRVVAFVKSPGGMNLTSGLLGAVIGTLVGGYISHGSAQQLQRETIIESRSAELRAHYASLFAAYFRLIETGRSTTRHAELFAGQGAVQTPGPEMYAAYGEQYLELRRLTYAVMTLEEDRELLSEALVLFAMTPSPAKLSLNDGRLRLSTGYPTMREQKRVLFNEIRDRSLTLLDSVRESNGLAAVPREDDEDIAAMVEEIQTRLRAESP